MFGSSANNLSVRCKYDVDVCVLYHLQPRKPKKSEKKRKKELEKKKQKKPVIVVEEEEETPEETKPVVEEQKNEEDEEEKKRAREETLKTVERKNLINQIATVLQKRKPSFTTHIDTLQIV
jgi:predicted nucleotidyltransferase